MTDQRREEAAAVRRWVAEQLREVGVALGPGELERIEVADMGLGRLEVEGLQVLVYENNARYCAKELVLRPRQTCPEHRHPPRGPGEPGKMETFRCRKGRVWLYLPGEPSASPHARIPAGSKRWYTARHEVELLPGDQFTIPPDTLHWFQAGDEGAVVSEFSSSSDDASDVYTNPRIRRLTAPA